MGLAMLAESELSGLGRRYAALMTTRPSSDNRPPYRRVADVLREEIRTGALAPGQQLPSHRELQERFEIANMTARSALRVLRDEGLIYTEQGRGSFVQWPEGQEPTPRRYTMRVGRNEHWVGPPRALNPFRKVPAEEPEGATDVPSDGFTGEELAEAFATHEPGTLNWPDASPEFNALAQQVHGLTQQVEQMTALFQQVLDAVKKSEAP